MPQSINSAHPETPNKDFKNRKPTHTWRGAFKPLPFISGFITLIHMVMNLKKEMSTVLGNSPHEIGS